MCILKIQWTRNHASFAAAPSSLSPSQLASFTFPRPIDILIKLGSRYTFIGHPSPAIPTPLPPQIDKSIHNKRKPSKHGLCPQKMSLSSEKIYKRKTSTINRQNLLNALFGKYIKTVHCGALSTNTKFNDRQLIRYEYFNDIQACLMNYCQLTENRNASGSKDERKSCLRNTDKRKSVKRTASVSFKKNKIIGGIGGASGSDGAKPNLRSTSKGRDCDDSEQEDEAEGEDARKLGQQSS